MISIESPIVKSAQVPIPKPEDEDLEPIGEFEPITEDDFAVPEPAIPEENEIREIKPATDFSFLPFAPAPEKEELPIEPSQMLANEIPLPVSDLDQVNASLGIREKIFYSLNNTVPMRIKYLTLDGMSRTERTIHPDYVRFAGTGRYVLIAWDELYGDWRAFAVDNIQEAILIEG